MLDGLESSEKVIIAPQLAPKLMARSEQCCLQTPRCLQERSRTDDCAEASGGRRPLCVEEEYASSFIPYLEYLFKVSVTVTYSQ